MDNVLAKERSAFSKGFAAWGGGHEPVVVGCDRLGCLGSRCGSRRAGAWPGSRAAYRLCYGQTRPRARTQSARKSRPSMGGVPYPAGT